MESCSIKNCNQIGYSKDINGNMVCIYHYHNRPMPKIAGIKIGRNDNCLCGSGKKFKKCCMKKVKDEN